MTIRHGLVSTTSYTYNKKGFLTQSKSTSYSKNESGKFVSNSSHVEKYAVKMKKGLPNSITSTESTGYKTVWTCNKKGLITSTTEYFPSGSVYSKHTYKYKYKKGRVVSVTEYNTDNVATAKWIFKYSKEKANKQRYAQMINSFIGSGYPSNWY